jgi:phosphatidate cytidylyltransferase
MPKRKSKEQKNKKAVDDTVDAPKGDNEHAKENKMGSFYIRTVTTIAMLVGFVLLLFLGHVYVAGFVIFLLILCFKELKSLKRQKEIDNRIPFFNLVSWYFFLIYVAFLLPLYLPNQTKFGVTDPTLLAIFDYHMLFSFGGFIFGVLLFTLSLEKDTYYYQFKMLGWTLMILLVVVSQVCSQIYNTYKGMYWFIFPALCVI